MNPKPTASGAIGLCLIPDDHRLSLGVNDWGDYWHCFGGCGGGSVVGSWMKRKGSEFTKAARELAQMML